MTGMTVGDYIRCGMEGSFMNTDSAQIRQDFISAIDKGYPVLIRYREHADCASYGGFLWSQGFTFDEAGFKKFRSQEARQILADAGREAMGKDLFAVVQFENILD